MNLPTIEELEAELLQRGIPERAAKLGAPKLHKAFTNSNMALTALHPGNKNYREIWSRMTGVKLPKSQSGTDAAIVGYFKARQEA